MYPETTIRDIRSAQWAGGQDTAKARWSRTTRNTFPGGGAARPRAASGITGPWPGGYWWAGRAWSHHQNHRRPLAHGSPAKWGKRSARPSTRPATRPGSGPTWAPWARSGLIRGGPGRYGPQAKQILMVMNDFFLLMGRYRCPTNEKGVLYRKIRRNTIDDIANNEPEWNAWCLNIPRWGIADGDGDTYIYITSDS